MPAPVDIPVTGTPRRLHLRLLAGFAGLLLLMGSVAVDSAYQLREVRRLSSRLRTEHVARDAVLDQLRGGIYHASTVMRDGLLTADESARAQLGAELERLRAESDRLLNRYQTLAPAEHAAVEQLAARDREYFRLLAASLAAGRQAAIRETVLPRRTELIALVAQVDTLNRRDAEGAEQQIEAIQAAFQRRVETLSLVALILGAALAAAVLLRQRALEGEVAGRIHDLQEARRDLRQLSNRLLAVQEDERRSISRELHDQVGQSMSALLMDLGRLESRLAGQESCREILASARHIAEENLARVRDLSLLLRPSMLDELGLIPALQWQAREVMRRTGMRVKLRADDMDDDLPDSHRTCVFRIVQEALHNAVRHAHAAEVRIAISRTADALEVSVSDDGSGFDTSRHKGLGLLGMEERACHLGGSLGVESGPGRGTVVSLRLPVAPVPAREVSF